MVHREIADPIAFFKRTLLQEGIQVSPLGLLVDNVILAKSHNKCIIYFDGEK